MLYLCLVTFEYKVSVLCVLHSSGTASALQAAYLLVEMNVKL